MENDIVARKVAQDVLLFILFYQTELAEEPRLELSFVPDITAQLVKNLSLSVWIDSCCNEFIWKGYIRKHFERMTATPFLFTIYVYHACHILNRNIANAYESFLGAFSLVTHFVLYCMQKEKRQFLNMGVELFCAFFEKEIRAKFEEQGGWQNFNEYLVEKHERLKRYKELIKENKTPGEIFSKIQEEYIQVVEPYVINEVVLKDITETQVEGNIETVGFADPILQKMWRLYKQTLEEVIADFAEIDEQVEKLYREKVGEATGGIANEAEETSLQKDQKDIDVKTNDLEQSSLKKDQDTLGKATKVEQPASQGVQKEILEKNASKSSSKRNQDQTLDLDSLKSQDCSPAQKSDSKPKLTNAKKAQILLQNMKDDVPKMYELIKYICTPMQMMSTVQNL